MQVKLYFPFKFLIRVLPLLSPPPKVLRLQDGTFVKSLILEINIKGAKCSMNTYHRTPFPWEKSWNFLLRTQERWMCPSSGWIWGKVGTPRRNSRKGALEASSVSLGLNAFTVRDVGIPFRCHQCLCGQVFTFPN